MSHGIMNGSSFAGPSSDVVSGTVEPQEPDQNGDDDALPEEIFENFEDCNNDIDPDVALKLIEKGRASGNRAALWTRSVIQRNFFLLGKFIHRYAGYVLIAGLIILCTLCLGLRRISLETRVEKLWVEEGGRLDDEHNYIQHTHGSSAGATAQILLQTPDKQFFPSLLTPQALLLHLKAASVATRIEVEAFKSTWTFNDICHKFSFPNFDERIPMISQMLDHLYPCSVISPLDCFWEGAKLLGPQNPVVIPGYPGRVTWSNLNLKKMVSGLEQVKEEVGNFDAKPLVDFLTKAGISGYVERPCLNPYDPECPETAPNKHTKRLPDMADVLAHGCYGISTRYMHWHEELLMGNIKRNKSQHIISSSAFQTIFHINGAKTLFETWKDDSKTQGEEWTEDSAAAVLEAWQAKFKAEVTRVLRNESMGKDSIVVYAESSLAPILAAMSEISIVRIATSYVLMIVYVFMVLKRWSDPINSHSGLGIAGTLLATLSIAAGLSLCSVVGVVFNALSTQIVPFIALGINVHYIIQMVKTLSELVEDEVAAEDFSAETLKRNGLSVTVSSFVTSGAFFAAYLVPIPALRTFAIQMGVLTLLGCSSTLILFPAVISLDQRRRFAKRLDVFCCYGRPSTEINVQYMASEVVKIGSLVRPVVPLRHHKCAFSSRGRPSKVPCNCGQLGQKLGPLDIRLMESGILRPGAGGAAVTFNGSTNSIFRLDTPTCCSNLEVACESVHVTKWITRCYLWMITNACVKFLVTIFFCVVMACSAWGIHHIQDGLDLTEFIPKGTQEHRYFDVSSKSFGLYNMYAVTKGNFEYQHNQPALHDYHQAFQRIDQIIKNDNGGLPKYWLASFRDWLIDLDSAFERDLTKGCFHEERWYNNASDDGILAFKLRAQTGKNEKSHDVEQVAITRLVDEKGIINPKGFYNYLSAWTTNEELSYSASQAMFYPEPKPWLHDPHDGNLVVPKSLPLEFAQYHFYVHNLNTTDQIVKLVKQVRVISDTFQLHGLPNFPSGTLFTFWEQYINLRFHLVVALLVLLVGLFVLISIVLMNPWTAAVMVFMTAVLLIEISGMIGWMHIKLNAVLAVIIVFSVGFSVQYCFHICMVFAMNYGCKTRRVKCSLQKSIPSILYGSVAMLSGVAMLAFSSFDFIFRYFFILLAVLVALATTNSLLFLPVLLSLLGPVGDFVPNEDPEQIPALTPEPQPESRNRLSYCSSRNFRHGCRGAISTASLSTISEEDSISCQQIFLEPELIVQTTTSFPSASACGNSDYKSAQDVNAHASITTTVSTRAKLKIEVHRSGM